MAKRQTIKRDNRKNITVLKTHHITSLTQLHLSGPLILSLKITFMIYKKNTPSRFLRIS